MQGHRVFSVLRSVVVVAMVAASGSGAQERAATRCSWDDMSRRIFHPGDDQRCEYHGEIVGRVLDSTHVAIGMRDQQQRSLDLVVMEITDGSLRDRQWNWITTHGTAIVEHGQLYVPAPNAEVPSLAFGRFADPLAAAYPDAVRIGVYTVMTSEYPDLEPRDIFEMHPSTGCREPVSAVRRCMNADGHRFIVVWGFRLK